MAKSDGGTSSGNTRGGVYQVFLNFCGRDTRYFAEILHQELKNNSIYSFIDDEELQVGEEIGGELLQAIDNSQIYIPIFSKNYAHSKWCLRELRRMVDNTQLSKEKKILPIFFDVEPNDVNLKTPLYKTAIKKHKEEHKKKFPHGEASWEGESWEDALQKVDKIKGWKLEKCEGPAELSSLVAKKVLLRLKMKYKSVTPHLVGLDGPLAEIRKLLDVNRAGDVRLLTLYGIGGSGKTTLAKVIYNELSSRFGKCCSFLDDVRETSKKEGLLRLQKKLLTEIVGSNSAEIIDDVDYGKRRIEETLGNMKVFMVLDDVDDEKQIENLMGQGWLHPGTRIIITTRKKSVMEKRAREMEAMNSDQSPKFPLYEMKGMNAAHALELFVRHASLKDSLAEDFDKLSREIVNTTGGLPLALEVIGAFLCGKGKAIWTDTLDKLKVIPHQNVREKLMISYEALEDYEREIFLDVACCLIDEDVTNAIYMWDDCKLFPNLAIDVLVSMSLVKIKDNNRFWMHDQLRDLGRYIVRQGSPENLGKRTRLWTSKEVLDFVRTKERKETVKALDLRAREGYRIYITNEQIERFENLRFLKLSKGAFIGELIVGPKLRWISWCPTLTYSPINSIQLRNLLVLEILENDFNDDCKVWNSLKMATNLKSLTLLRCDFITRSPNLSGCLTLERLNIVDCEHLREIDSSIEMLTCLLDLNIGNCDLVGQMPDEIGGLVKFEYISLNRCHKVRRLPTFICNLVSLKKLDLSQTDMRSLPDSIQKLSCSIDLILLLSGILKIPKAIEGLVELRRLDLGFYKLRSQEIQLHGCSQLQKLRLEHCDVHSLSIPSSIRTLRVGECPNITEIQFLGLSSSLEKLFIDRCWSIRMIVLCGEGGSVGALNQSVSSSSESTYQSPGSSSESTYHSPGVLLPDASKKLEILKLSFCRYLLEIQVIGTLLSLQDVSIYSCHAMEKFDVSNLKNLHRLVINMCNALRVVEGLDEQEFLTMLDITWCRSLEMLLDMSKSKIPDECLTQIMYCGDSLISSAKYSEYNKYIPFKRYKEMAQQGAPQSKTNKGEAKMDGDAVKPDTELRSPFHSSASSWDHEIGVEPPIDSDREGIPPEKQNQTADQDLNSFSLDELGPPRTFCDRFRTCLVSILECVCSYDFLKFFEVRNRGSI